jgi:hypothetical protein
MPHAIDILLTTIEGAAYLCRSSGEGGARVTALASAGYRGRMSRSNALPDSRAASRAVV